MEINQLPKPEQAFIDYVESHKHLINAVLTYHVDSQLDPLEHLEKIIKILDPFTLNRISEIRKCYEETCFDSDDTRAGLIYPWIEATIDITNILHGILKDLNDEAQVNDHALEVLELIAGKEAREKLENKHKREYNKLQRDGIFNTIKQRSKNVLSHYISRLNENKIDMKVMKQQIITYSSIVGPIISKLEEVFIEEA